MVSLEQLRKGLGISQEELANVMEVQQPAISKLVRRHLVGRRAFNLAQPDSVIPRE